MIILLLRKKQVTTALVVSSPFLLARLPSARCSQHPRLGLYRARSGRRQQPGAHLFLHISFPSLPFHLLPSLFHLSAGWFRCRGRSSRSGRDARPCTLGVRVHEGGRREGVPHLLGGLVRGLRSRPLPFAFVWCLRRRGWHCRRGGGPGGVVAALVSSLNFSCAVCNSLRSSPFYAVRLFILSLISVTVAAKAATSALLSSTDFRRFSCASRSCWRISSTSR
jgi:hypothetical protein